MDGNGGKYLSVPAGGSRLPTSIKSLQNRQHFVKQDGKTVYKHAVKGIELTRFSPPLQQMTSKPDHLLSY